MKFICPHCQQHLAGDDELAGLEVQCPSCNKRMTVTAAPGSAPATAGPAPAGQTAAGAGRKKSAVREADGTNVNLLISGLVGLGLTIAFYLLAIVPFKGSYLYGLFMQRGWVTFAEAFLMWWSVAFLYYKGRKISDQRRCMLFDALPDEIGGEITADNVDRFIKHLRLLPGKASESFLIARVLRGLEHFRIRNSNPEVATVLSLQADIDANTMQSSYTLLKTFIWAIPILGFIGTVQGLGSAVGGFSSGLESATDLSVVKNSLSAITVGLAVAFDTTLVALVMSVLLMFPTSSMQKAEEDLLSRIDDYCADHLLKRLHERSSTASATATGTVNPDAIRQALEAATRVQTDALRAWTDRLEHVGATLAKTTEDSLKRLSEHNTNTQYIVAAAVTKANESLCLYFNNLQNGMKALREEVSELKAQGLQLEQPPRRRWNPFRRRQP